MNTTVNHIRVYSSADLDSAKHNGFKKFLCICGFEMYAYNGKSADLVKEVHGIKYDPNSELYSGCPISEAFDTYFE